MAEEGAAGWGAELGPEGAGSERGPGEGPAGCSRGGAGPGAPEAEAQLQEAVLRKAQGNELYRDRRYRAAIGKYHRALLLLRGLDPEVTAPMRSFVAQRAVLSAQQEALLRSTQVDCYNNLAACLLQRPLVDYARVREYSLRVLRWREGDVKALYRAGVATLQLGDPRTARQYLLQASRGQPHDANVRKYLRLTEERLSSDHENPSRRLLSSSSVKAKKFISA
nr:PREDICTED: tetratricopeptide repeat protein 9C [Lepisosteus oculatus]